MSYNFRGASAKDKYVFGASRPGYPSTFQVTRVMILEWTNFMKTKGISRVCCLLDSNELSFYSDNLLYVYAEEFGEMNICYAPINQDLSKRNDLIKIVLNFLNQSVSNKSKVVVHCSLGQARTGHILKTWAACKV